MSAEPTRTASGARRGSPEPVAPRQTSRPRAWRSSALKAALNDGQRARRRARTPTAVARQRLGEGGHPARLPARAACSRSATGDARSRSSTRTPTRSGASTLDGRRAHRARRLVDPRRLLRRAGRRLHAADVRQRRRVRRRGHDGRLARAGRLVRADRQARATSPRPRRSAACSSRSGALPVIIEDDVLVGGNCGVYEGTIVRARAVLGAGHDAHARHAGVRSGRTTGLPPRRRPAARDSRPAPWSFPARAPVRAGPGEDGGHRRSTRRSS